MINKKPYLKLPFDQFSRQLQVAELIDALRGENESFRILDVGGYKGVTAEIHTGDEVTVLDVFDVKEKNYVKGDGLNLPFEDGSFDFVVSFDVFEHINDKDRQRFIHESSRVAKRGVITAAPVRTPANEAAERKLNNLYKALHGEEHQWLKEHIEYGLPRPGQAKTCMEQKELNTTVLNSNDTTFWVLMQTAMFLTSKYRQAGKELEDLIIDYNKVGPFDGSILSEENYRHIVAGFKAKSDHRQIINWASAASKTLTPEVKVALAERVGQFYLGLQQAAAVHADDLTKLVAQKDISLTQFRDENNKLKEELNEVKSSKRYKLAAKLANIKPRTKK